MASTSGGGLQGPVARNFPSLTGFGASTTLLLTEKDGGKLPNPFVIGKNVEDLVGAIEHARTEARGSRYIIRTRRANQVEKLLQLKTLSDNTEVTVQIHPTLNTSRCVIVSNDLIELSEETIQSNLSSQGVIGVRRITRNKVNTPTIVLTFNRSDFPEKVKVGIIRCSTRTYYPSPMLCFRCYEYGHIKSKCDKQQTCDNCSQRHEEGEECTSESFCRNCKGNHRPSSKQCPIYKREVDVIRTKFDFNLPYPEARKRVLGGNGSYAQVTSNPNPTQVKLNQVTNENKRKDEEISKLKQQLDQFSELNAKIEDLYKMIKEKDAVIANLAEELKNKEALLRNQHDKSPKISSKKFNAKRSTTTGRSTHSPPVKKFSKYPVINEKRKGNHDANVVYDSISEAEMDCSGSIQPNTSSNGQ